VDASTIASIASLLVAVTSFIAAIAALASVVLTAWSNYRIARRLDVIHEKIEQRPENSSPH
jgi:hypothetical protein